MTRETETVFKAIVTNTLSNPKNIQIQWILSDGIIILNGNQIEKCGIIQPNSQCISKLLVFVTESTELGKNQVKVRVIYD